MGAEAPSPNASTHEVIAPLSVWTRSQRSALLAGCVAFAAVLCGFSHMQNAKGDVATGPRAKLELVRVDDSINPFDKMVDDERERVVLQPVMVDGHVTKSAVLRLRDGESPAAGTARFRKWLARVSLPSGARFGFGNAVDVDDPTQENVTGIRAFILSGDPIVRTDDVENAQAGINAEQYTITVKLSADSALRFEAMTRQWTKRRMAIVIDDVVYCAPIIQSAITGGHVSITMGQDAAAARKLEGLLRK